VSRAPLAGRLKVDRAQWVRLIGGARQLARTVAALSDVPAPDRDFVHQIEAFRRELRGAKGENFPAGRIASNALIADAFVATGRAFGEASPERRSAIAPALGQLAGLLDDFLEELRAAEVRGHYWQERD
jgi:hypothetical protein